MDQTVTARDDWDSHWEQYSEVTASNPAHEYRRQLIFRELADLIQGPEGEGTQLLDIGSGQGDFAREVSRRYPKTAILGLDLSQQGVEIARKKVPSGTFLQRDLLQSADVPPGQRQWADVAVCSEVLEHLDEPRKFLEHVSDYLAPSGRVLFTVPGGPRTFFDRHIGHRTHFTPRSFRALLESSGFKVERVYGAGFPFFNLYKLLLLVRGRRLVTDVAAGADTSTRGLARRVMDLFGILFRLNRARSPWGWQIVALARRS
ncbi:MAG TPA: class I SAM-dependent methyltransferase [Bdellovibrionota bacterium]|jgi:2-polyprenyl-3-methyl-5-hydroxy-6-metoxy-1,4-benzoquinol methylase|nr:class I SAM-dependent methyltransferase [Bdellovibrionota bacterium]